MAVSVDRFLAIRLHLSYQQVVIDKRVVAVVILICAKRLLVYFRIYFAVRRHENQIEALQVQW